MRGRGAGLGRFVGLLAAAVVFALVAAATMLFGGAVRSAAHPEVPWPIAVQHGWWMMDLEGGEWKPWDGPYSLQVTCESDIFDYTLQYPHRHFKCVEG